MHGFSHKICLKTVWCFACAFNNNSCVSTQFKNIYIAAQFLSLIKAGELAESTFFTKVIIAYYKTEKNIRYN